jgi:hypothetical protein
MLIKAANKPNKKKAARRKKCVSEGCTNQSVSFRKCISHAAKVNKTKCKALLSSGERCKNMHRNMGYAENTLVIILMTPFKIVRRWSDSGESRTGRGETKGR